MGLTVFDEDALLKEFCCAIPDILGLDSLSELLKNVFKGHHLVKEYVLWFDNGLNQKRYIYDTDAIITADPAFIELINDPLGFGGSLNEEVLSSATAKIWDISLAVKNGGISPWKFFLHRIGITQITGIRLHSGTHNLGVLWFEPQVSSPMLFRVIAAQLSMAISAILAREKIDRLAAEIDAFSTQLNQQAGNLAYAIPTEQGTEIIGQGLQIQKIYNLIKKVASSYATVLISGETGTGKELVAHAIHQASSRKDQPFIKINCATLPPNLIESELFGHEKGSFTGAVERRIGKFEQADNGTLFLDEIGEMPLDLQMKLLRTIQEREIERLGSSKIIKVNVRLIVATNKNLAAEVDKGRFRSDLFYRLNVFPIEMPPLRERKEDIPDLVNFFIRRHGAGSGGIVTSVSRSVLDVMMNYPWPGNVRELEHLIERSLLLTEGTVLDEIYLPPLVRHDSSLTHLHLIKTLEEVEREHILQVLESCSWKISGPGGAAVKLGIPATTLSSKLIRLKIKK